MYIHAHCIHIQIVRGLTAELLSDAVMPLLLENTVVCFFAKQ